MVSAVTRALASLVVPPLCAVCREPELSGAAVCPDCRARLTPLSDPRCSRCGAPGRQEATRCPECRGRPLAFASAWAPFAYEGIPRCLVRALKSGRAISAAAFMGAQIAARAPGNVMRGTLVPVPVHASRHRRHGFNQATELAHALGRVAGLPVDDVLIRRASASRQVGLERRARLANAIGSVRVRERAQVPARAVLVDDVYTTGATLDACARALREEGVEEVVATTFARVVRP